MNLSCLKTLTLCLCLLTSTCFAKTTPMAKIATKQQLIEVKSMLTQLSDAEYNKTLVELAEKAQLGGQEKLATALYEMSEVDSRPAVIEHLNDKLTNASENGAILILAFPLIWIWSKLFGFEDYEAVWVIFIVVILAVATLDEETAEQI